MAVIEIPKRPTIAKSVLREQLEESVALANKQHHREIIEKSVIEIDQNVDLLFCIHAMLESSSYVPTEALESLQTIHIRLRRLTDDIFATM